MKPAINDDFLLVLTTCEDPESARRLATKAIEAGLVACVNQLPGVNSFYLWEGQLQQTNEIMLLMKTRACVYERLEKLIKEAHPYELPEIIAVPIQHGSTEYLQWIEQNTAT